MKADELLKVIEEVENKERIKLLKALSEKHYSRKPTTNEVAELIAESMDRDEQGLRISRKGEVWFGYNEQVQLRPYVVLSDQDVIVSEIDSGTEVKNKFDVVIEQWEDAGLGEPSVVRYSRIFTFHENLFGFKVGELSEEDLQRVINTLQKYFS